MTFRVILISPDAELTVRLREALDSDGINAETTLLNEYPSASQLRAVVNSRPETVTAFIVGLSDEGQAMGLIRELRSSYSDALAVAASNASSAEIILASMRAGASEFLFTPFDVADLRETFEKHKRATGVAAATNVNGRLMCVLPAQGGNGASTLAVHLATAVNKLSKQKVLLIDYDFHCGTVAFRMRLKPDFSFADALDRISDIDELWGRLTSSQILRRGQTSREKRCVMSRRSLRRRSARTLTFSWISRRRSTPRAETYWDSLVRST